MATDFCTSEVWGWCGLALLSLLVREPLMRELRGAHRVIPLKTFLNHFALLCAGTV
jgi:hypothetical protein